MRGNKLEPTNLGPYLVIRQETSGEDKSNAVLVSEVNDSAKEHTFHASTLKIFPGTLDEAKELAKMDHLEYTIVRTLNIRGNPANRETLIVIVELEDGSIEEIPYREACYTQSFGEFCEKQTIGKELSLTREELAQYAIEQNPTTKQTIKEKMLTWEDEEQIQVNDRRYITAHHWNSTTWSIHSKQETLPKELRNVEPLLEAIVVKICPKTIDLEIPLLASHAGKKTRKYIISLSLARLLLFTTKGDNIREASRIMDHAMLDKCTLREDIHLASGW
jgi:hypothetical protein